MNRTTLALVGGALLLTVLVYAGSAFIPEPAQQPIGLFPQADPPTDWTPEPDGPLGNRPVIAYHFVRVDAQVANDELYTPEPPFDVTIKLAEDAVFEARVERVVEVGDGLHVVEGSVKSDVYGRLNLVFTETTARGVVHVDNRVFELIPATVRVTVVAEIDQGDYPREADPVPAHWQSRVLMGVEPAAPSVGVILGMPVEISAPPPPPEIGVLVVQSSIEFADCNDLDTKAALYESMLDDAFNGIATSSVTFKCSDATPDWADMPVARQFVMADDDVRTWRIEVGADLVVLLVKDEDDTLPCGFAMGPAYPDYVITPDPIDADEPLDVVLPANPTWVHFYAWYGAYAVVEEGCAATGYTFAHEIGHLVGMSHERFEEFGGEEDNCGYGYPVMQGGDPVGRTIMAYPGYCSYRGVDVADCPRFNRYSHPLPEEDGIFGQLKSLFAGCFDKIYGQPCDAPGIHHLDSAAHNEERLRETAAIVATYSQNLPPVDAGTESDEAEALRQPLRLEPPVMQDEL